MHAPSRRSPVLSSTMRPVCLRCRRPESVCYCEAIPQIPSRTRVVFLQHPRERRVAIGTARMAHLALPNSELHQGVSFDGHPAVEALAEKPGTVVLFPSPEARPLESFLDAPPSNLVVVDGTWPLARKVIKQSQVLSRLPRLGFTPSRPGNYRIRKEPAEHCLSTIEAVVEVLGRLEQAPERFSGMLRAFELMVDRQIACARARVGPSRHKRHNGPPRPRVPRLLLERRADLVVVYGEANARGRDHREFPPELVHLVAERISTGERFEAVVRPRHPLAANAPYQLGLSEEALRAGEPVEAALDRFEAFLRAGDVLVGWGVFWFNLLRAERSFSREVIDVRRATADVLRQKPDGPEDGAQRLGLAGLEVWAQGRAGRRLAAISGVTATLAARA